MSYLLKKACMQSYTVSNNCITTRQNKEIQNHNDKWHVKMKLDDVLAILCISLLSSVPAKGFKDVFPLKKVYTLLPKILVPL